MKRIEKLTAEHLAIYLGQDLKLECRNFGSNKKTFEVDFLGVHKSDIYITNPYGGTDYSEFEDIFPILRTRQSITPEELETFSICFRMWYDKPYFDYNLMVFSDIVQMAKLHIDIFGLIENGLAVDKETIKK